MNNRLKLYAKKNNTDNNTSEYTLRFLYKTVVGRGFLKLLTQPAISKTASHFMNSKLSKPMIKRFILKNNINMNEFENRSYKSYNDFFTRKIIDGKRIIDMEPNHFISPADSKLSVYPIMENSEFKIKDSRYTICDLLNGDEIYKNYINGYCLIFRLTVNDYHRYCYLDNGTKSDNTFILGKLHTVKPIALDRYNIYKENCREYTALYTENFGNIVQIEVGAMLVGKIKNLHSTHKFMRGDEKGMFEFGGSTIVLLIEKNKVVINEEILNNSSKNIETIVKMGEKVGVKYEEAKL